MKRIHIEIIGRVQGVGFRYSLYAKAIQLGIKGWVKNKDDGNLEAVFEGEQDKIAKILDYCKKGPFLAKIENINVEEEDFRGEDKFRIVK